MDENLIVYYLKHWDAYTKSVPVVNGMFRYLNRNWIPRQIDECKPNIYTVDIVRFPPPRPPLRRMGTHGLCCVGRGRLPLPPHTHTPPPRAGRDAVQLALVIWRDRFFEKVRPQIIGATLRLIERERRGDVTNTSWIKAVVNSCVSLSIIQEKDAKDELQLYTNAFEKPFLEATRKYYEADSTVFLEQHTLREYMRRVETSLHDEVERVQLYLHRKTEAAVTAECEHTLLVRHKDAIADEFTVLLENDGYEGMRAPSPSSSPPPPGPRGPSAQVLTCPAVGLACRLACACVRHLDLGRAFSLLSRLKDGLSPLRDVFEKHVRAGGLAIIDALGDTAETVRPCVAGAVVIGGSS